MFHSSTSRWEHSHRDFLVSYTNDLEGTISVLEPNKTRMEKVGEPREIRKARVNPAVMDIAFGGEPLACSASTCGLLKEIYPFRERQSIREAGNYKYIIDVRCSVYSGSHSPADPRFPPGRWQWLVRPLQKADDYEFNGVQIDHIP